MKILFIGKFQPPHLGHVLTINLLRKKYSHIDIGITAGKPRLLSQNKVSKIFNLVFFNDKNIKVKVLFGAVDEGTVEIEDKYDYIISGNKSILKKLKAKGHKVKYQERFKGYLFSGSKLRLIMK